MRRRRRRGGRRGQPWPRRTAAPAAPGAAVRPQVPPSGAEQRAAASAALAAASSGSAIGTAKATTTCRPPRAPPPPPPAGPRRCEGAAERRRRRGRRRRVDVWAGLRALVLTNTVHAHTAHSLEPNPHTVWRGVPSPGSTVWASSVVGPQWWCRAATAAATAATVAATVAGATGCRRSTRSRPRTRFSHRRRGRRATCALDRLAEAVVLRQLLLAEAVVLDSFGTSFKLMPSSNVSQTHETLAVRGFLYFPTPGCWVSKVAGAFMQSPLEIGLARLYHQESLSSLCFFWHVGRTALSSGSTSSPCIRCRRPLQMFSPRRTCCCRLALGPEGLQAALFGLLQGHERAGLFLVACEQARSQWVAGAGASRGAGERVRGRAAYGSTRCCSSGCTFCSSSSPAWPPPPRPAPRPAGGRRGREPWFLLAHRLGSNGARAAPAQGARRAKKCRCGGGSGTHGGVPVFRALSAAGLGSWPRRRLERRENEWPENSRIEHTPTRLRRRE